MDTTNSRPKLEPLGGMKAYVANRKKELQGKIKHEPEMTPMTTVITPANGLVNLASEDGSEQGEVKRESSVASDNFGLEPEPIVRRQPHARPDDSPYFQPPRGIKRRSEPSDDELYAPASPPTEQARAVRSSWHGEFGVKNENPHLNGPSSAVRQTPNASLFVSVEGTPDTATPAVPSKRPRESGASDFQQGPAANLPKIQKREPVTSPRSPVNADAGEDETDGHVPAVVDERPPRWYTDIPNPVRRGRNDDSGADTLLSSLRTMITKCKYTFVRDRGPIFHDIDHKLHTIAFFEVTGPMLKKNRMLHNQDGLPQLFEAEFGGGVAWPWYIQADAHELYNKWCRRVFQTDLMRGIQFNVTLPSNSGGKGGDRIDPNYDAKVPAKYHGNGDLINGQWWPLQLCALRDGAHGAAQGGICGREGQGAYSVIMSGDHDYPDEDHGEWVLYCGTDSSDGTITTNTSLMLESAESKLPVRLLRSAKLESVFAPRKGLRYDGLYVVTGFEKMDGERSKRQRHRFRLERCPGQDPIRGGNGQESRPTKQELDKYEEHQRLKGKGKKK